MSSRLNENTRHYVNDFNKAIYLRGAKHFGFIFLVSVTLIMGISFIFGKITNRDNVYSASTQNVVKFAKVQYNSNENFIGGETTALANSNEQQELNIRGFDSNLETIDLSNKSKEIDNTSSLNETKLPSENVETFNNTESTFESFIAYVDCNARIRSTPSKEDNSNIISEKSNGYAVDIIGEDGDWWKIQWNEDGFAYIHKTCVKTK